MSLVSFEEKGVKVGDGIETMESRRSWLDMSLNAETDENLWFKEGRSDISDMSLTAETEESLWFKA